jgi:putative ABC transport system permease protein
MAAVLRDILYGVRVLWNAPHFSLAAALALALGLGATATIFSVVDAVLIKPLPFREPARLVVVYERSAAQKRSKMFVPAANFHAWREQSRSFVAMAAVLETRMNLTGGPNGPLDPEELRGERVSAALFPLLGVEAAIGRTFRAEEDEPGNTGFVLLSHSLWRRKFGADPAIAGKAIRLRDRPYTVTGVLPPAFALIDRDVDIWLPLGLDPHDPRTSGARMLVGVARLKPGVTLDQARNEMDSIGARLEAANPALNSGWRPSLFPLEREIVGTSREALLVLFGAVGLLLLLACANVANLLLARGAARRREIAVRAALGAGRWRLLWQLLTENVVLALAGGAAGLALAWGALALVTRYGPGDIPRLTDAQLDARLCLFAFCLSVATGVLSGLAPALRVSGGNLYSALVESGRGGTAERAGLRLRDGLIVAEVALAVVVLIGAGLLVRSFIRLRATDPGFRAEGLLTFRVPLLGGRNSAPERRRAFFAEIEERLAALPGVHSVGSVNELPLTGLGVGATFAVDGRPAPTLDQRPIALMRAVTPGYFKTINIRLLAGRGFSAADTAGAPPVVIVNQTLARRFWPDGRALGERLIIDLPNKIAPEIVGVVGDVKPDRMEADDWPTIYNPYPQAPAVTMEVVVRTAGPPLALASAVQREVHRLDPEQPVAGMRPMQSLLDDAVAGVRFNMLLLTIFAEIAFVLAAVGIYGVISYDVTRRTREIGIRTAMGAQPRDVLQLVLRRGARLAGCGIAAGLAIAFALTRLMSAMLYGVKATDAFTFAGIALLLGAVALLASYLPSRRAMALDPLAALRHE